MSMAKSGLVMCGALVLWCSYFVLTEGAPENDLVTHLPGFNGSFPSKHYSGYVTIDPDHEKRLFYYLVTSERDPSKDPVVLWLVGCSSFDSFVYGHGPFNFEAGSDRGSLPRLHLNPYSWSKVSNIIYLDSPAGVGFSDSKNLSDYKIGELEIARDSHTFLLKWFELYPEFLPNPFFIAGQAHGGVFVPTLALEVGKGIEAGAKPVLNLKGYLVGNGFTDEEFDRNARIPFLHGMALISDDLYEEVNRECKGNHYKQDSPTCLIKLHKVWQVTLLLNKFNVLEPCHEGRYAWTVTATNDRLPASYKRLGETERPLPVRKQMFGRAWPLRASGRVHPVATWPQLLGRFGIPCYDDSIAFHWLNDPDVRKAIHAKEAGEYELCPHKVLYNVDAGSMINYHKNLTVRGYRALIFSGDHDMTVPYIGTQAWTRSMGYKIVDEWRAWFSNKQVAGFLQGYDYNLTFLTIKGAGQTVPWHKPREALEFYSRFLAGQSI